MMPKKKHRSSNTLQGKNLVRWLIQIKSIKRGKEGENVFNIKTMSEEDESTVLPLVVGKFNVTF